MLPDHVSEAISTALLDGAAGILKTAQRLQEHLLVKAGHLASSSLLNLPHPEAELVQELVARAGELIALAESIQYARERKGDGQ